MSTCLVKEHLVMEDCKKDPQALELLRKRLLSFSMSLMPRGNMHRCELALRAGKQLHAFAGKLPTPQYYGLLQAAMEAETLEFIGLYEYDWEDWWEESREADPYLFESFLLRRGDSENLFYSMYAADENDPGEVIAFGLKNGRGYHGVVPFARIPEVPPRGRWFAPTVTIHYGRQDFDSLDVHSLLPICKELCSLGGRQELQVSRHSFHFCLRNLELYTREQVLKYEDLLRKLKALTGPQGAVFEELAELSSADPQILLPSEDGALVTIL